MTSWSRLAVLAAAAVVLAVASPAHAMFPLTLGTSWDGPSNALQNVLDARYGAGAINVQTDYLGHAPGDIDPWFWVDTHFSALLIKEIAGNANRNVVGWYLEPDGLTPPVIDGVDDGVVFDGPAGAGTLKLVVFNQPLTKFGFYMNPNGTLGAINAPEPERFFTNRLWNDRGPDGSGATHAPLDGDVQALVFDLSKLGTPDTWLVCFEDLDAGATPGACCTTDDDYNDFIFEVTAFGATPARPMTFGALKALYLR